MTECNCKNSQRYMWLKRQAPLMITSIAWRYKSACSDKVNTEGIDFILDTAMEEENELRGIKKES